jgi:hypothetical protein
MRGFHGLAVAVVLAAGPKEVMVRTAVAGAPLAICTASGGSVVDA